MKRILIQAFLFLVFSACQNHIKFDKTKWLQKNDMGYPYRKAMLKDLTTNKKIKGLSYKELVNLLGIPWGNMIGDSNKVYYPVYEFYGSDIDPIHTINLAIQLNGDSVVTDFRIDEWKK